MELKEARKQLRELGFKIQVQRLSWGRHAIFINEDNERFPSLFTPEQRAKWLPLINWLEKLEEQIEDKGEYIYGFSKTKVQS